MIMPFYSKIARGYLIFVSLLYAVIGVGFVLSGVPLVTLVLSLLVSGVASFVVVLPWPLLTPYISPILVGFAGGYYTPPEFAFSLPALGVVVFVLGIVGRFALERAEKDIQWIFFWYFLSLLVFVIAVYNLSVVQDSTLQMMGFVNASLVALATYTIHREIRRTAVGLSA